MTPVLGISLADPAQTLTDLDVTTCERVVFYGRPAAVALTCAVAAAMAPRAVSVVGWAKGTLTPEEHARLTSSLITVGLTFDGTKVETTCMLRASDIVLAIDCDAPTSDDVKPSASCQLTVGDPDDANAELGSPPRAPYLLPNARNGHDVDTRWRFTVGLVRHLCQALFARSTAVDVDSEDDR